MSREWIFRFDGYQDNGKGHRFPLFTVYRDRFPISTSEDMNKVFELDTTGGPNLFSRFNCKIPTDFKNMDVKIGTIFILREGE